MTYTISQAAEKMGVTVTAIGYYDKEGLLPFVEKKQAGTRVFRDEDLSGLKIISCMKDSGMPIKDIRRYMDLCREGDSTLKDRLEIFFQRRDVVEKQIEDLGKVLEIINHKIRYYETAITAGTDVIHNLNHDTIKNMDTESYSRE